MRPRSFSRYSRHRAPAGDGELLAEVGERDLVHLDERLALRGDLALLAAAFQFGDRNAEATREHAHRFVEADLFLQLDELEDVAADAAAEAVEEALVRVDVNDGVFSP